jgi:Tfp pilus assembly protein PilZ
MPVERRRYKRFKKPVVLKMSSLGMKDRPSINIGLGGFLIESDKFYEINRILKMEIKSANKSPIHCKVKIAWIDPTTRSAQKYKIGLQFLDISPEDQKKLKEILE